MDIREAIKDNFKKHRKKRKWICHIKSCENITVDRTHLLYECSIFNRKRKKLLGNKTITSEVDRLKVFTDESKRDNLKKFKTEIKNYCTNKHFSKNIKTD